MVIFLLKCDENNISVATFWHPQSYHILLLKVVEGAAELLYGLIHARYILTGRGMLKMLDKFHSASFGRCSRVLCQGQNVLPVGVSDTPRNCTVAVYCPRCEVRRISSYFSS